LFGFPTQFKYVIAPLSFVFLVLLLELFQPTTSKFLGFFPDQIAQGELWRVVTGQLLHTNLNHVLLNIAGLALVWALHGEYYSTRHYAFIITTTLALVGLTLAFIYNNTNYAGLSGIIHSMILYGAFIDLANNKKSGYLIIIGVWLKVIYENIFGASTSTSDLIEAQVAVEAHLIGAIVGSLIGLFYLLKRKKKALK